MNEDDLQIENILDNHKKKKKVDGKAKGDRTELNLCKLLTKFFKVEFSKALGSGSRWSQVGHLPEHAKKTLTGDICVPEGFQWVMECKGGYENDLDLNRVCDGPIAILEEFIEQVSRDAEYSGRKPIICWKRNRKPWLAIVLHKDLVKHEDKFEYLVCYREWRIVKFEDLLSSTGRNFWFEEKKK
jgi:Holliday junction resolvase